MKHYKTRVYVKTWYDLIIEANDRDEAEHKAENGMGIISGEDNEVKKEWYFVESVEEVKDE